MAVAFDAVAIPALAFYEATFSWTHTPVGTPKGVAVIVVQELSPDQVSGVKYGGVVMDRVRSDVRTATEACRVYIYFLGSGIPTGAQIVEVTLSGVEDCNAVSLTVTATANTAVDTSAGADAGIIANPSLTIVPTVAAEIFYGIASGLAAPVTTVQTGSTHVAGKDYGIDSAMWARKSVAGGGSTTIGYTAAIDDVCHSALAIKEYTAQTFYATGDAIATGLVATTRSMLLNTVSLTATGVVIASAAVIYSINVALSALGIVERTLQVNKIVSITSLGIVTSSRQINKIFALTATAIPAILKQVSKTFSLTSTGIVSASNKTTFLVNSAVTSIGLVTASVFATFVKLISITASGIVDIVTKFISGGGEQGKHRWFSGIPTWPNFGKRR